MLDDPGDPREEIIYLGLYDQALAVRPDRATVWDVPIGLPAPPPPPEGVTAYHHFGLNYQVQADRVEDSSLQR
jgi:hypothetical protein